MSEWGKRLSRGWPARPGASAALPAGSSPLRALLETLGSPMRARENGDVQRVLGPGWVLEPKYDGDRALGAKLDQETSLVGRGGNAGWMRSHFPEVARSLTKLKRPAVLDGEIVAFDALGRSHHRTVQASDDRRFVAFDVLWTAEHGDVRHLPLQERRALLEPLILEADDARLLLAERLPGNSVEAVVEMCRRRGEGVMAKRASAPYESGGTRSPHWLKLKPRWTQPMAISGHRVHASAPRRVQRLLLNDVQPDGFDFAASVKPPSSEAGALLFQLLSQDVSSEPRHVVQVSYPVWVPSGPLSHVSLIGVRDDLRPLDCVRAAALPLAPSLPASAPPVFPPLRAPERRIRPASVVTRGQLRAAYETVLPRLLPFLQHRPVTLYRLSTRAHERMSGAAALQAVLENDAVALDLANHGEASPWQPDWMAFQLLPRTGAGMPQVAEAARRLHGLLAELGLESFAKTRGDATPALDVLVPLVPPLQHALVQPAAERVAAALQQGLPALFRDVRIDTGANGPEGTVRAPGSPGNDAVGTGSWPLAWSQVQGTLQPRELTVASAPLSPDADPWARFFSVQQALPALE